MNEDDDLIQTSGADRVAGENPEPTQTEEEEPSFVESGFLDEDEPPKPKPAAAAPEKPKETATERRERAALEAELKAAKEENEYWRKVKATAPEPAPEPKPAKAAAAPRDQTLTVDQQLDLLVRNPAEYFKQAGMVTQEEAERIAAEKAEERAAALFEKSRAAQREESQLLTEFGPDLAKPESDLFKRTTRILRESGVDEKSLGDTRLLRMAAKAAKAEIDAEAVKSRGKQDRIAAQGPTGRRVTGDSVVLSETQIKFAKAMGIKDMSLVEREARKMRGM